MNPEQLLKQVEEAIKNRPASTAKRYWLYAHEGKILCLPVEPIPAGGQLLATLSHADIEEGFTERGWGQLLLKVAKAKEDKIL